MPISSSLLNKPKLVKIKKIYDYVQKITVKLVQKQEVLILISIMLVTLDVSIVLPTHQKEIMLKSI